MRRFFASNSEQAVNENLTGDNTDDSSVNDDDVEDGVQIHPLSSSTTSNTHNNNNNTSIHHSESVSTLPQHHENLRPIRSDSNMANNNDSSTDDGTSNTIIGSSIINNYYETNRTTQSNSVVSQDVKMSKVLLSPALLPGEEIIDKDTQVFEWNGHTSPQRVAWHQGVLFITNYRLIFKPATQSTYDDVPHQFQGSDIPLCTISKLEKIGGKTNSTKDYSYLIEIFTKNFQHVKFAFVPTRGTRGRIFRTIRDDRNPEHFFAYKYRLTIPPPTTNTIGEATSPTGVESPSNGSSSNGIPSILPTPSSEPVDGWRVYDLVKEYTRQGVLSNNNVTPQNTSHRQIKTPPSNMSKQNWRICTLNQNYKICDTYPSLFLVPNNLSDEEVKAAAEFRSRGRIPVLSWYDPETELSLTRCAQPMIGLNFTGKITKKHIGDYRTIESIMQASEKTQQRLMIVDLRPRANAEANRVIKGAGYEKNYKNCELRFMNIENIHVVRNSFARLADVCHDFGGVELNWHSKVESTQWLEHIRSILTAAHFCVDVFFRERTSVLTHCSDGWDRTSQVVCLFQIMADPYCRTMEGFAVLIEKEWCAFGHQFQKRIGHGSRQTFYTDERGPIFVQFIDCVYQMMRQHPTAFEFNELFLIFVLDNLYSCRFGNFIFDNERERVKYKIYEKTHSMWTYLLNRNVLVEYEGCGTNYLNPFYDPDNTTYVIYPDLRHSSIQLWSTYWLRYAKDPNGYEYYGYTPLHTLQIRANEIIADMNKLQEIKALSESKNEATVQTFQREFKNMWEEIQRLKKKNEELEEKYKRDTEALIDLCEKQKEELSNYANTQQNL
ncbi:myotubularin-related [Naegleria gruberi]|uniref:Myotubularin-related n=1 Tax=Naegleria gruberi TaxID=5762 RepID=D2VJH8_NAEGR|nr:myotubularin-related [Naegleria gruberi]EFC43042.1 myotubularin-related [Naegleria gruberi]|eukprot:XP_002675786.1 myotubularin-related [Naegleria gruberi strain NEG-M]